jgi:N-acetylmuramoyl-L-alanine amidase
LLQTGDGPNLNRIKGISIQKNSNIGNLLFSKASLFYSYKNIIFFLLFFLFFSAFDPTRLLADGELAQALLSKDKFFQNGSSSKRADWLALIKEFEHAAEVQPRIEPASRARYLAADIALRCYQKFKQPPDVLKAGRLARKSVKDCPRCSNAPEALVVLGQALMAQGQSEEAYRELMKVELNYREATEAVDRARELMAKLSGKPSPKNNSEPKLAEISKAGGKPTPDSMATRSGQTATAKNQDTNQNYSKISNKDSNKDSQAKSASINSPEKKTTPPKERANPKPPSPRADGLAQVYALYLDDQDSYTEVTAYLDRVTPYLYNLLPPSREGGRFRLYVDFKESRLAQKGVKSPTKYTSLIKTLKVNQLNDETVRLVADMPSAYPYTPIFLDHPPRMIIRVASQAGLLPPVEVEEPPTPRVSVREAPKPKPAPSRPAKGPTDSMARQLGLGIRLVAIDAGHGGKDGGAAGNDLKEKDITLKVSKMLAQKLRERLGLEVIMTREKDIFVTLDRRTKTARDKKADLFISLHVNANDLAKVEGFES